MRTATAVAVLALLLAIDVVAFLAATPPWALALLLAASFAALRGGRLGTAVAIAVGLALNALLLGGAIRGGAAWDVAGLGWVRLHEEGVRRGLVGGLRVAAVATGNAAVLQWARPAPWLDALRLPRRATAFVAAVLLAAQEAGRQWARLRDARRLEGAWPARRLARARAGAALLPALLVDAWRRAADRSDALRLAGIGVGPRFAPVVAVTALAVAGRLAFVALPNVALTYVVVFLGGLAFGARVGAAAGFLAMALTDLWLTGLLPLAYVNAPAMAAVGALGGAVRRLDLAAPGPQWAGRAVAAALGLLSTLVFSVAADAATWLLVPELRGHVGALRVLVLAGLAFNVVPALVNAALFGAAAVPVARAFRALQPQSAASASAVAHAVDGPETLGKPPSAF